jgi:hypothetical protein
MNGARAGFVVGKEHFRFSRLSTKADLSLVAEQYDRRERYAVHQRAGFAQAPTAWQASESFLSKFLA